MTSSGVSVRPFKSWVPYACSKSAMNYLCSGIVLEEEGKVRSVTISPGIVDTTMQAEVRDVRKLIQVTTGLAWSDETLDKDTMPKEQYQWTVSLKEKGLLLILDQPATAHVRLALHGIPDSVLGTMLSGTTTAFPSEGSLISNDWESLLWLKTTSWISALEANNSKT